MTIWFLNVTNIEGSAIVSDSDNRNLPVTFSSFIVSLAGSAMMHLGQAPHPASGQTEVNLPIAKNTIDLLGLLNEKTNGNLDEEEAALMKAVLDELSNHYDNAKASA